VLATVSGLVAGRKLKLTEALAAVGAVALPEETWREWDPEGRFAININTPQSLAHARALAGAGVG
jgi:hypothetical protein